MGLTEHSWVRLRRQVHPDPPPYFKLKNHLWDEDRAIPMASVYPIAEKDPHGASTAKCVPVRSDFHEVPIYMQRHAPGPPPPPPHYLSISHPHPNWNVLMFWTTPPPPPPHERIYKCMHGRMPVPIFSGQWVHSGRLFRDDFPRIGKGCLERSVGYRFPR